MADIEGALEEVLPFLEKEARLANIQIHRHYQGPVGRVRIEEVQLEEILINLISNAIQAMTERGRGNIWISAGQDGDKIMLAIRDDGPGIDVKVRDRLFDPFVSTKARGHGTGLGLSICYGIIKHYDGEIRVESTPGEGALFQVILPVCRTPPEQESDG